MRDSNSNQKGVGVEVRGLKKHFRSTPPRQGWYW